MSIKINMVGAGGGGGGSNSGSVTISNTFILPGLTKEQVEEKALLEEQHSVKIKNHALDEFKKLSPEIRQNVINQCEWNAFVNKINDTKIEVDPKLQELRKIDQNLTFTLGNYTTWGGYSFNNLPKELSNEDIKKAHVEASLEEEILNKT